MLSITVSKGEFYDQENNEFIYSDEKVLKLEHSLISLSKWESKWNKPFLTKNVKSLEETLDYIRCMTLTPNVKPEVYKSINSKNIKEVNDYIGATMTATTFAKDASKGDNSKVTTAEIIYYLMVSHNIPFDPCQKWHLDRLMTLIKVCNIKNSPPKKRSAKEIVNNNRAINRARRKKYNSEG